jgi:PAS domain S-box-containing protein
MALGDFGAREAVSMVKTSPKGSHKPADRGSEPKGGNARTPSGLPLELTNDHFRLLVESVRDYAIFMLDPTGHVSTWNLGAARIKGYSADEIIGQHFSVFYCQEDVARGWPAHELKVAAAEGRFEDEGWRVRKDGTLFWANVIITALYDQGRLYGFSKVTRDLTERKQAEEELRQARDLLEMRVQERTAQIEELLDKLRVADRRKNEFLATLAHELRNPLAPIRNALQLFDLAEDDPKVQRQARGVIERQLGQMVRLIDDLLDVSRITNNKLPLRKARIELAAAVESALETARPLIDRAGHELTVKLPPEPVYVDADLMRLAQIFTNLLNNSAKYTEGPGHIWLVAEPQGREVVVTVRDTGIGITAEQLPHLFEMFSQGVSALQRPAGGLGVGLALARGLVELHGGNIEARSEGAGKGSELIVHLPLAAAPSPPQRQPASASGPRRKSKARILIADDNQDSAESLSLILELSGYETWVAHDGLEAVQTAMAHRPDVALLDIGMPKINGYEAARRIREQPWGQRMLLIAITGWGQEDDKRQALEAGFDHHVTKPVHLPDLERLLASRTENR